MRYQKLISEKQKKSDREENIMFRRWFEDGKNPARTGVIREGMEKIRWRTTEPDRRKIKIYKETAQ